MKNITFTLSIFLMTSAVLATGAIAGQIECANPNTDQIFCMQRETADSFTLQAGNTNVGAYGQVTRCQAERAPNEPANTLSQAEYFSCGVYAEPSVLEYGQGDIEVVSQGHATLYRCSGVGACD